MAEVNATIKRGQYDREHPYYLTPRALAQDGNLSYEALGLLNYILSKPDDWEVNVSDLQRDKCGRDKVYRVLGELTSAGYVTPRKKYRDEKGQWIWTPYLVFDRPQTETHNPLPEKPYTENQEIYKITTTTAISASEEDLPERPLIYTAYEQNVGPLTPIIADTLKEAVAEYSEPTVIDAIKEARQSSGGHISWKYISSILKRWKLEGQHTSNPIQFPQQNRQRYNGDVVVSTVTLADMLDHGPNHKPGVPRITLINGYEDEE